MARKSTFWSWHASVNDGVRHDLIEKGWFGRQTTQDLDSNDMPALATEQDESDQNGAEQQFPEIYGQSQQAEQEQEL